MSQDDPFAAFEGDRTLVMPSPGGRGPAPQPGGAAPARPAAEPTLMSTVLAAGMNPLLSAANPLLDLVPELRTTLHHPDPAGLKEALAHNIRQFEGRAKAAGVAPEKVIAARYVLCTLLDETAASTPWGGSGVWGRHSLLVMFHNEAWGGEKVFQLLAKLAENPAGNRDMLELMYVCLALGFEGRYRVLDNGRQQLEALRERLAQMLRSQRGEYERDLSPHWRGAPVKKRALFESLPLWVAGAIAALLLVGAYSYFAVKLNTDSDPLFAAIQGIRVQAPAPRVAAAPPPPAAPASRSGRGARREQPQRDHHPRRRLLRARQRDDRRQGAAAARPHRRSPERGAGSGADHRPHRQRADPLRPLPVELAPVAGARQVGRATARRHGGSCAALVRGTRGQRGGGAERHPGQPGAQPPRRDHPLPRPPGFLSADAQHTNRRAA